MKGGIKTRYNPIRRRRSIRLPGYDYAQPGAYFVTICAQNRKCLFGQITDDTMHPNQIGGIVKEEWLLSEQIRQEIALDDFVVMPNHLHAIVWTDARNEILKLLTQSGRIINLY